MCIRQVSTGIYVDVCTLQHICGTNHKPENHCTNHFRITHQDSDIVVFIGIVFVVVERLSFTNSGDTNPMEDGGVFVSIDTTSLLPDF